MPLTHADEKVHLATEEVLAIYRAKCEVCVPWPSLEYLYLCKSFVGKGWLCDRYFPRKINSPSASEKLLQGGGGSPRKGANNLTLGTHKHQTASNAWPHPYVHVGLPIFKFIT